MEKIKLDVILFIIQKSMDEMIKEDEILASYNFDYEIYPKKTTIVRIYKPYAI